MDLDKSAIIISPKEILANNTMISTITVQLKDSQGNNLTSGINPESGQPYEISLFTVNDPQLGEITPKDFMVNHDNGTFTATVKSGTIGTDECGFNVDGERAALTDTVVYTNGLGEFDQNKSSITAVPSENQADGLSISVITVTLVHANTDQPLTGLSSDELTILTSDEKPMIGELGEMI